MKLVRIPFGYIAILHCTDFSEFGILGYRFGEFQICVIYISQDGQFHISCSDQACCVRGRI